MIHDCYKFVDWVGPTHCCLTLDLCLQKDYHNSQARKRGRERKEEEEKTKKKKKAKEEEEEEEMATTTSVEASGGEARCPHHPRGSGFVCLEAKFHEELKQRLIDSGNLLESLLRAIDGDVDEQWALDHPVDVAAFQFPVGRPAVTGWSCTPLPIFSVSNRNLAANTLVLARCQLELEKEAARNPPTRSVSEDVNPMPV